MKQKVFFIINQDFAFYTDAQGHLMLCNLRTNYESEISMIMHEVISLFFVPRSLQSASEVFCSRYQVDKEYCIEIIDELIEKKIITKYIPLKNEKLLNLGGMYGADVVDIAEVFKSAYYNVVFLGFPYDLSATNKSGSRFAPQYLRNESKAIFQYIEKEGTVQGMWSRIEQRYILENVRMADCGDIHNVVYHRNGKEFDYLQQMVRRLVGRSMFPVILGGDHSISIATISGAASALRKIGVIHFDAHDDFGGDTNSKDWRNHCHHGNFMSWIVANENVELIAQIGIRQLSQEKYEHSKIKAWSVQAVEQLLSDIYRSIPNDIPYFITFDVDCLDPCVINSTGTPIPGGFTYMDIIKIIEGICKNYKIIGCDIVELIPGNNNEGLIVSQIILLLLDNIFKYQNKETNRLELN